MTDRRKTDVLSNLPFLYDQIRFLSALLIQVPAARQLIREFHMIDEIQGFTFSSKTRFLNFNSAIARARSLSDPLFSLRDRT